MNKISEGRTFAEFVSRGGNLSDSDLRGADFSGAHLYGTYFYHADCSDCDFEGVLLQGVVLDDVILTRVNFVDACLGADNISLPCSLLGTDLSKANLAQRGVDRLHI